MDQQLFLLIHNLAGKSRVLDFFGIFFAEYLDYFLLVAVLILIWQTGRGDDWAPDWKKQVHYYSFLALALILSRGIFTELIRFLYHRPRPFLVLHFQPLIEEMNQGAFPSGHAAFYFGLAGAVYLLNKRLGWYAIGASALMGLARVFVGVHWPLDILGGAAVAALSVYLVYLLLGASKKE